MKELKINFNTSFNKFNHSKLKMINISYLYKLILMSTINLKKWLELYILKIL